MDFSTPQKVGLSVLYDAKFTHLSSTVVRTSDASLCVPFRPLTPTLFIHFSCQIVISVGLANAAVNAAMSSVAKVPPRPRLMRNSSAIHLLSTIAIFVYQFHSIFKMQTPASHQYGDGGSRCNCEAVKRAR